MIVLPEVLGKDFKVGDLHSTERIKIDVEFRAELVSIHPYLCDAILSGNLYLESFNYELILLTAQKIWFYYLDNKDQVTEKLHNLAASAWVLASIILDCHVLNSIEAEYKPI